MSQIQFISQIAFWLKRLSVIRRFLSFWVIFTSVMYIAEALGLRYRRRRPSENGLSDFRGLWYPNCYRTGSEAPDADGNHRTEAKSAGTTARKRRDEPQRSADPAATSGQGAAGRAPGVELRAIFDAIFFFTRMGWQRQRLRWEAPTLTTVNRCLMRALTRLFWRGPTLGCGCKRMKNPWEFLWPTMLLG